MIIRLSPLFALPLGVTIFAGCSSWSPSHPAVSTGISKSRSEDRASDMRGIASFYGEEFQGRPTASGEPFNQHHLTAAHRTLPFGTRVRVKHLATGKSIVVRINDRGPFIEGRIIDLSREAARHLGIYQDGVALVKLEVLD